MENAWGVSPLTLNLIKRFEGYTPKPKWDYRQHSVGYGTRWEPGTPVGTQQDHEAALAREAGSVNGWLAKNVTVPLDEQKRGALTSFGFNLGVDDLERLKPDINAGNWPTVAKRMLSFNKAGGEVNQGLVNRRRQEAETLLGQSLPQEDPSMLQPRPSQVQALGGTSMGAPTGGPMPAAISPAPDASKSALVKALLQAHMQRAPQSRNWMEAVGNALPMWAAAYQDSKLGDERKAHSSSLAKALLEAKDNDTLTSTLLSSGDPDLQKSAITLKAAQIKTAEDAKKPQVGRYKVENGVVVDSVTGQIVAGQLGNSGEKPPSGYRATPDGNLSAIPGGPADPATNNRQVKYNEGQTKAANFGKMMTEAEKLIGDQANPLGFWGQLRENMTPEVLSNQMRSPEYQKYRQAADQWIRAKLRKESGATITPEESEGEFRTFFPQPGDGPEVVEQKKLARQQAIQGMQAESGGAYDALFQGQPAAGSPAPAAAQPAPAAPPAASDLRSVPRPQGITDEQIKQEAFQAIRSGKDEQAVRQQLEAWGIKF
jgi:GH24 family phage-related lysozyme (muramidase)